MATMPTVERYTLIMMSPDGRIVCNACDDLEEAIFLGGMSLRCGQACAFDVFQTQPVRQFIPETQYPAL